MAYMALSDSAADVTDHKLSPCVPVPGAAGDIGVQAADAVDEAFTLPEFQSAINRLRFCAPRHFAEDVVGT